MALYKLTATNDVVRTTDNSTIPNDPANSDRIAYATWIALGNTPDPYVPPPAVIPNISDRQFFQHLANLEVITEAEALAANAAVIPAALETLIVGLPSEQQFPARMLISGATVFERNHPMTLAIGVGYGWTSEQIDDFFLDASEL